MDLKKFRFDWVEARKSVLNKTEMTPEERYRVMKFIVRYEEGMFAAIKRELDAMRQAKGEE